jgi:hypothetical protein
MRSAVCDIADGGRAAQEKRGVGMRGCVLTFFILSLLAPPLLQVGHAVRRAWWPWLEMDICSTNPGQRHAPDDNNSSWVLVGSAPRLTIRRD